MRAGSVLRPLPRWRTALCALLVLVAAASAVCAQGGTRSEPPPPPPPSPPLPSPPQTQTDVAIALVLAVDVSGSVSNDRFELQKQGYAAAFRNPQVLSSIRALVTQSIAVTMMQWTGPRLHVVVVDWARINDEASADAVAAAIEAAPRQLYGGGTSISGAIDYSRVLLAQGPFSGARRIIDISGDGSNNSGRSVTQARDEAVHDGIGINGLPILTLEPYLDHYYYDNVIGGPGAFVIPVANYDAFADAILRKLITEIAATGRDATQSFAIGAASQTRPTLGSSPSMPRYPSVTPKSVQAR